MNYLKVLSQSFFSKKYIYIDKLDYLADKIFTKHNIRVKFDGTYADTKGTDYCVVFCKVPKKHESQFINCMIELQRNMLLTGHTDYVDFCTKLWEDFKKKEIDLRKG